MSEVSTFRLYLLRAMYLFMFVGLAVYKWPEILNPPAGISNAGAVVGSVLGAVSLLALLGIRYPLKLLPLLFFEFIWKSMWVLMWGLPLWSANQLTPETAESLLACMMGVVLTPLVLPWGYLLKHYVKAPGDPWRKQSVANTPKQPVVSAQATSSSGL